MDVWQPEPWRAEHGEEFLVPYEIYRMGGVFDLSYGNDVCPRFCVTEDGVGPNLWVDHPDPDRREFGPDRKRFLVTMQMGETASSDDYEVCETDDLAEAIRCFTGAVLTWAARN